MDCIRNCEKGNVHCTNPWLYLDKDSFVCRTCFSFKSCIMQKLKLEQDKKGESKNEV